MTRPRGDASRPEPEWIFQRSGLVLGPVTLSQLREMLFAGEVDAATPVSRDGASFEPIAEVASLLVDLRKAEASLRVQREVTGVRRRAARRRRARSAGIALASLALIGGAVAGARWLAAARSAVTRSALLEDFGAGVELSAPARIGTRRAPADEPPDEVAVPEPVPGAPPRASRPARGRAATAPRPASGATGGAPAGATPAVVQASWDESDVAGVVARQQRTLAPCLRQEAARSPQFAGEIPVEFAVLNDGRVGTLWIDEPRFKRGPLHDCLRAALQGEGWRFRPFPGQQPVVALVFRIGRP